MNLACVRKNPICDSWLLIANEVKPGQVSIVINEKLPHTCQISKAKVKPSNNSYNV